MTNESKREDGAISLIIVVSPISLHQQHGEHYCVIPNPCNGIAEQPQGHKRGLLIIFSLVM